MTVFISALLACAAFMTPRLAAKAASRPVSARSHLLGCWDKILGPEQVKSASNPDVPSLRPSFELCFYKSGKGETYAVNPSEREGVNTGFRWRLAGKSRLVVDVDADIGCGLNLEDGRTLTLNGCPFSGKFSKKCSRADEAAECTQ